jgi:hypothetical protein
VHIFSQIQWQGDPTIAAASSMQIVIIGSPHRQLPRRRCHSAASLAWSTYNVFDGLKPLLA